MPDDRFLHRRAGHSDKVNLLNDLEFRVWVQYLLSADDFGVLRFSAVTLQADNDHLSGRPAATVTRCLEAVKGRGLIRTFEHQSRIYAFQPDWQDYQKVNYPRATTHPCPSDELLAECTEATRLLFAQHPGGGGRKRRERNGSGSGSVPGTDQEPFQECSSPTRAGGPAERLTANGQRLTAEGSSEGSLRETGEPRFDEWLIELQEDYPRQRVTSGWLTQTAFVDALNSYPDGPRAGWAVMRANLQNQKQGHEWRVKRMIPKLQNWLKNGDWLQQHDEYPPDTLVSEKTSRTLSSAAAFIKGGDK